MEGMGFSDFFLPPHTCLPGIVFSSSSFSTPLFPFCLCLFPKYIGFWGLEGFWGQPQGPNFPFPWAAMLAFRLDCATAAVSAPRRFNPTESWLSSRCLAAVIVRELGISMLTSAAHSIFLVLLSMACLLF